MHYTIIQPGSRLGRYEIRSHIGAGGMGDVYLARDIELDRSVALKVLPPAVAADQQRMRRFVQEAKAASSLNPRTSSPFMKSVKLIQRALLLPNLSMASHSDNISDAVV